MGGTGYGLQFSKWLWQQDEVKHDQLGKELLLNKYIVRLHYGRVETRFSLGFLWVSFIVPESLVNWHSEKNEIALDQWWHGLQSYFNARWTTCWLSRRELEFWRLTACFVVSSKVFVGASHRLYKANDSDAFFLERFTFGNNVSNGFEEEAKWSVADPINAILMETLFKTESWDNLEWILYSVERLGALLQALSVFVSNFIETTVRLYRRY